jgi:Carboxypeptidase regulatory-like domain
VPSGGAVRGRGLSVAIVALLLALACAPPAGAKAKKAKDLGPTPVANDCLIYKGGHPCYYDLWSGRFVVDKHLLNVGDTMSAQIQTYGGRYPAYSWAPPGGPGLKTISCPGVAPAGPKDGSPNYFSLQCSFKATGKTNGWVVFGPSMGLAISSYVDGDYYAVVAGSAVSGRVLDAEGNAVKGARINISGPEDVYADTDDAGFYEAVDLSPGDYTVSIAKDKFCHDNGEDTIAAKTCKKSVKKHLGAAEVNFRGLGKFAIYGKVRDEFKRGLPGVTIAATGLPGGATKNIVTGADGGYRIGFEGGATVNLTSQKGGGPYSFYYVVKPDGTPSTGQSADVTPNSKEKQVKVDWELDRRLEYGAFPGNASPHAKGNGFGHLTWVGHVRTQHFDPAPNVPFVISPIAGTPAAYCSTDEKLLWPTTFADGALDTVGGFELKTDSQGRLPIEVYPGTKGGAALFDVTRKSDTTDTTRAFVAIDDIPGTPITDSASLVRTLAAGGNQGLGLAPSPDQIVEWFANSHYNAGFQAGGIDIMKVKAGGHEAVAFFPRNGGPKVGADGYLGPSSQTFVLDPSAFINLTGLTSLPSLAEWAGSSAASISKPDLRTYDGWPIPARSGGSFGDCMDTAAGGTSTFTVHSPVNLLLTDAAGKQLGIGADGKPKAEFSGVVQRNGDAVTIIAPPGAYTASLVGTGKGSATIESHTPSGNSVLRFSSKKGAKASIKVADGRGLGPVKFAGAKIKPISGLPLAITGLPKTWRDGLAIEIKDAMVVDPSGLPVSGATITTPGFGDELFRLTADGGGTLSGFWPTLRKGKHTLTISAPGYTTTKLVVVVKRRL